MSDDLGTAYRGAGAAQSFATGTSPEREANRAAARASKEEGEQQLARLKATKPTAQDHSNLAEIQSLEIKNLKAQNTQALRDKNERLTYGGFERYDTTGEVRHLNQTLSDLGDSKLLGDIVRFDNLTEADADLMTQAGNVDQDKVINDPDVSRSFVKATMQDGSTQIVNMDDLKGRTRYGKYAATEELDRMKTSKQILMLDSMGYDSSPAGREAFRRVSAELGPNADPKSPEFQNALSVELDKAATRRKRSYVGTGTEAEREAKRRVAEQGISPNDPEYTEAMSAALSDVKTEFGRPSDVRKAEAADTARAQLDELGFGDVDWSEATDYSTRRKFEPAIRRIETLTKAELSATEIANLQNVKQMTSQVDSASELTEDQTGIIDNFLHGVKKYVSNNVEGVEATSAYSAFNNSMRSALFGATLPAGEQKMFTDAAGSLKHQQGPVLAQLRTSFETVRNMYETLLMTNDPDVMMYRTGMDAAQIENVTRALDERIDMIDRTSRGLPATVITPEQTTDTADVIIKPANRAKMDQWSGASK